MNRPASDHPPDAGARGTAAAGPSAPGSQTLARGLNALQLVASAPTGLTVAQVADDIGERKTTRAGCLGLGHGSMFGEPLVLGQQLTR